jgi:small-conductance mechanosensitive channel/CRP-like cAMP-binding protein
MEHIQAQPAFYMWGAALLLGIPLLILILGELIERLQQQGNPLAAELSNLRNLVLPLLSIRLILEHILGMPSSLLLVRVVETLLWLVVIYSSLHLLTLLVHGSGQTKEREFRLPRVWSELLRALTVVGVGFYVLGNIWGVPTEQVFAVLGVGSIVLGFALQDTLSSLVAGLFLAFEKPFEVGHWIRFGLYEGQIIEMNWRAVRLRTRERDVVVVPNSLLAKEVGVNFILLDPLHAEYIHASFAYHHPPNQIKRMLLETALATPGVVHDPAPHVRIQSYAYDKSAINYEIKLFLLDYIRTEFIRDEVLTRIYYATQRYNFAVPYSTTVFYERDAALLEPADAFPELLGYLQTIPYFATLEPQALEQLARGAALHYYGAEERLIRQGMFFTGFYVILEGQVQLTVRSEDGQEREVARLSAGGFFGETILLRERPSPFSVTVIQDMKTLFIQRTTLIDVVETNPKLAAEMSRFIEERTKMVHRVASLSESTEHQRSIPYGTNGHQPQTSKRVL